MELIEREWFSGPHPTVFLSQGRLFTRRDMVLPYGRKPKLRPLIRKTVPVTIRKGANTQITGFTV